MLVFLTEWLDTFFAWLKARSWNCVWQELVQLVFAQLVASAYTRSAREDFASALRPSKMEHLVSSFLLACASWTFCRTAPGIWHHQLQTASDRKVFCDQFPCSLGVFWILSPPAKRGVLGLFQDPFPAVFTPSRAFWTHLWLESQNAKKETTKGFFAALAGRGHQTVRFRRAFLVLLLLIPAYYSYFN